MMAGQLKIDLAQRPFVESQQRGTVQHPED
jgi:hypothetical protein